MASLREEIESRRTFAIISHPDAEADVEATVDAIIADVRARPYKQVHTSKKYFRRPVPPFFRSFTAHEEDV